MTTTTKELLALVGKWHGEGAVNCLTRYGQAKAECASELAPIANALCAEVEALKAALEVARDYVACARDAERQTFAGYEHCSDIESIEEDLAQIDAAIDAAKEPK